MHFYALLRLSFSVYFYLTVASSLAVSTSAVGMHISSMTYIAWEVELCSVTRVFTIVEVDEFCVKCCID